MSGRKGGAPPPPKVSPPQKFARAAEAAGWTVERSRFRAVDGPQPGVHRTVVATRPDVVESFEFEWIRNASTGRDNFVNGVRTVLGFSEEWSNVAAATREIEGPVQSYRVVGEGDDRRLLRLPFDIDTADDDTVLAELNGQTVVWRNSISGAEESATCPALSSQHFRVTTPVNGQRRDRVVHLTDATLDGGHVVGRFRSFALSQLLGVAS